MTTREELHLLVDQLPEGTLHGARRVLVAYVTEQDTVLKSMLEAPEDDEPTTPEEDASAVEAWQAYLRGECMTAEEAEREFLS
jgi:hypothetical protein